MSAQRDALAFWLLRLGFVQEWPFGGISGRRKWRWDFADPGPRRLIAVEYQGVMHRQASHLSVSGAVRDHQKVTEGQLCGWLVIQCNAKSVESGECLAWVERAIEMREAA